MKGSPPPVVALLAEQWQAIARFGDGLDDADWALPSECPGWTVKDLVSHMVGTERSLLGDPRPPSAPAHEHVHNPTGEANEAWVEARRGVGGTAVLEEFRAVTARRVEQLQEFDAERFDRVGPSPVGEVPYAQFMEVRVMDCWVHEQDMRVATGHPGDRDSAPARLALARIASAMPFVVGRKARAPEGYGVRFDMYDPQWHVDVVVDGERAHARAVEEPDSVLRMSTEVFWRLGCGRVSGEAALGAGLVIVEGDDLGRSVVEQMAFMI